MYHSAAALQDEHKPTFDIVRDAASLPIIQQLRTVCEQSGMTPNAIVRALSGLMFGPGRLTYQDFIKLRLFDKAIRQGPSLKAFVGQRRNRDLCLTINYRHDWLGLMANKVASSQYLAAYGLPVAPTAAIYAPKIDSLKANILRTRDDLAAFLLRPGNYPLFGKPVESFQSLGSVGLTGVHPHRRELDFFDGSTAGVDRLIADIDNHYAGGYLFQPLIAPDAAIATLCGSRLATVRIITTAMTDGPKIFRACWKIPAGGNVADNYWRSGNLLAQIDVESGRVLRVTSGTGLSTVEHTRHPDTDVPLIGFQHPEWDAMKRLAISGARAVRHVPLIGWDLACTVDGVMIIEMNETPDFFLPQFADRRGVLDSEFKVFLAHQQKNAAGFTRSCKAAVARL